MHYTVESESEADNSLITMTIIRALQDAGRLNSTRCMFFKAKPFGYGENEWEADISQLYDEYVGASVVVDCTDEEPMEYLLEEGSVLAESISKHKDDTLTILILPEENEELKNIIAPYLKSMKFIKLLDTEMNGKEAKESIADDDMYPWVKKATEKYLNDEFRIRFSENK